jgi:hypothetical protein
MNANKRIEHVKEVCEKIKRLVDNAKVVHPSPQISLRTLGKNYSITYIDKDRRFSVVQRVNVGNMDEYELLDFIRKENGEQINKS